MRVLVVDDSAIVRRRLVEVLTTLPNVEQVDTAASSSEARRAIASTRPDLVILDIHMPCGAGLEVLDAARACDPPITTIVLSNDPTPQSRHTCLRSGAKFFFDKSAECQQAVDAIARLALDGAASHDV
jgi:DNA-binding NarL/FixJ family response regulator